MSYTYSEGINVNYNYYLLVDLEEKRLGLLANIWVSNYLAGIVICKDLRLEIPVCIDYINKVPFFLPDLTSVGIREVLFTIGRLFREAKICKILHIFYVVYLIILNTLI